MCSIALGMGKPTREEILAEYYLRAAGVAAVWVDEHGNVGAQDVAPIEITPAHIVFCCERGVHFVLAYHLFEWKRGVEPEFHEQEASIRQRTLAAKLEELADAGGVGITPHVVAIDRALATVRTVNEKLDAMAAIGDMREINRAFKEARKVEPSLRYADYLDARKAGMLEALAREG